MITTIKNFLKSLLSDNGSVSSKRVAGFIALFNAIVLGYKGSNTDILNSFLIFAASAFGLSTIEKIKKNTEE